MRDCVALGHQAPQMDLGATTAPGADLTTLLVFDNPHARPLMNGTGPEPVRIAAAMSQAWIDFARSGNPSQPGLAWPAYDTAQRKTMIFDVDSPVKSDPDGQARIVLSG